MNRRNALRNIGTGISAIAITPTVVSLFQSCQTAPTYNPVFFTAEDFSAVAEIMELIIPSTDIPGAKELKLPEFTDAYIAAVWSDPQKESFVSGLEAFKTETLNASGKVTTDKITAQDWDTQLAKYLKGNYTPSEEEKDAAAFANELRSLTVNAFKTNEYIGENVLAYLPIPRNYIGCVDLMETTGGKAWSL